MNKYFRVGIGRQERITQTEITGEITYGVTLLLLFRNDFIGFFRRVGVIRISILSNGSIYAYLTLRLTALDSLIDFLNRPAIMRLIQETVTIETVIKPVFNFKAKE